MRKKFNPIRNIVFTIFAVLLVALSLLTPATSIAQESDRMNEESWEEATEGVNYGNTKEQEEEEEEIEPQEEDKEDSDSSFWNWDIGISQTLLKVLSISLIVILLTFVLVRLLGNRIGFGKLKEKKLSFTLEDVEENLEESDLERFKREALDKKDFKTAIRILYLMILKDLSIQNKIAWKREKTNSQYVREMRGNEGFKEFRDLTRSFEYVWYGEMPFSATDYQKLLPAFSSFLDRLEQQNSKSNEKE
ncbi:DUF4129 domain-containing protein [Halocola ammonii]